MKIGFKRLFLSKFKGAVLVLSTFICASIAAFAISYGLKLSGVLNDYLAVLTGYILFDLIVAVCSYFVVIKNASNIIHVLIISNLYVVLSVLLDSNFWKSPPNPSVMPVWFPIICGWMIFIVVSIIAAEKGRKEFYPYDQKN